MKILTLSISNLLRIKAAHITPDGKPVVVVAGKNDAGKTSVLNAIAIAFSGKEAPTQPIRTGSTKAEVILETEEFKITRSFSATGGARVEVVDKNGNKIASPQGFIDGFVSKVSFDPLAFMRLEPRKQAETIRQIAGLDFADLDADHAKAFELRTTVNRQAKEQEGRLTGINHDPSAPTEEVSIAELSQRLRDANAKNQEHANRREELSDGNDAIEGLGDAIKAADARIAELQQQIVVAQEARESSVARRTALIAARDALKIEVDALQDVDTAAIMEQMGTAEETNTKVRDNRRWNQEHQSLVALQSQSKELTNRLNDLQDKRAKRIDEAKLPIDGLSFDASTGGVTFGGVPFEQASASGQLKVSLAIACALNPKLPVMLIRDGSLLDDDSLKIVAEIAEERGAQVWLEMVSDDPEGSTVFIEDGTAYTPETAPKKHSKK